MNLKFPIDIHYFQENKSSICLKSEIYDIYIHYNLPSIYGIKIVKNGEHIRSGHSGTSVYNSDYTFKLNILLDLKNISEIHFENINEISTNEGNNINVDCILFSNGVNNVDSIILYPIGEFDGYHTKEMLIVRQPILSSL